jgi:hypothetical protein
MGVEGTLRLFLLQEESACDRLGGGMKSGERKKRGKKGKGRERSFWT